MKTTHFFSFFCSVQHRLNVSPQAAALFFFILGELSATEFVSNSVAMTNSRICGTIHISNAALRKCREELIAAGIITFSSADSGKSLSLYTLCETDNWHLDVVNIPAPKPQPEVATESPKIAPAPKPMSEVATESPGNEATSTPVVSEINQNLPEPEHNLATPPSLSPKIQQRVSVSAPQAPKKNTTSHQRSDTLNPILKQKIQAATAALRRHSSHPSKLIYRPTR